MSDCDADILPPVMTTCRSTTTSTAVRATHGWLRHQMRSTVQPAREITAGADTRASRLEEHWRG
jgi:hypothetical protein